MQIAKKEKKKRDRESSSAIANPAINSGKGMFGVVILGLLVICSILWVVNIGKKAEATVTVVMTANSIHKNQTITESDLRPYEMVQAEYEKYTIVNGSGNTVERRLILWDDRGEILNAFAAYPIKAETYLMYNDLVASRVDNSDTVLYSYPGKDIVQLTMGSGDLNAFKTFLQPGDKLNIEAIYSENTQIDEDDGYGNITKKTVQVFKSEPVFQNIMVADLINSNGDSILDIYSSYNEMSIWQQAQMDSSSSFQQSVEPASLLVALTPAEKERYYKFLYKDATFKISLPQRTQ